MKSDGNPLKFRRYDNSFRKSRPRRLFFSVGRRRLSRHICPICQKGFAVGSVRAPLNLIPPGYPFVTMASATWNRVTGKDYVVEAMSVPTSLPVHAQASQLRGPLDVLC